MINKFGIDRLLNKLPLHKLSARMAYCLFFNVLLLFFVVVLTLTDKHIDTFPNAWDFRCIIFMTIVVFFVGISDLFRDNS
jgi:hypothetical protein